MRNPLEEALAAAPKKRTGPGDWTRYCGGHTPHPKQAEFLALDCLEACFGGAAGGGKSDALLMAALQYVDVPGYAAIVFRRTYQDLALPGAIMDRSHEWLAGTDAQWLGTDKRWTFPSGATLSFGYLDTDRDRFRYASAEFQCVCFDELTQFPERWYQFLFSRIRRTRCVDVPLRMRSGTNPGGIGHEWVRRRFLSDVTSCPPFVPSRLDDNPSIDAEAYRTSLERLDSQTRSQLLDGVWVRDAGGLVYAFDERRNIVDEAPRCDYHVLALDFGFTDATGFVILGWKKHEQRVVVLRAWKVWKRTPSEVGEMVAKLEEAYSFDAIVGDVGGLGKAYAEEARKRFRVPIEPAEKRNKRGYIALLNGALEKGELLLVRGATEELSGELVELPWNEDRSQEVDGFDNHLADAMLYGWRRCSAWSEEAPGPETRMTREELAESRAVARHDTEKQRDWWDQGFAEVDDDGDPYGAG